MSGLNVRDFLTKVLKLKLFKKKKKTSKRQTIGSLEPFFFSTYSPNCTIPFFDINYQPGLPASGQAPDSTHLRFIVDIPPIEYELQMDKLTNGHSNIIFLHALK